MERNVILGMIPLVIGMITLLIAHIPLKILIHPYLARVKMLRSDQFIHFAAPISLRDYRIVRTSRHESAWAYYLVSAIFWLYYLCLIAFVVTIIGIAIYDVSAHQTKKHGFTTINLEKIF
ncbi:MAG: hypothetical protein EOM20_00430 [Spartobacteria bacterium]|nr:hypothetical protein [Spartobacteria bacterium]